MQDALAKKMALDTKLAGLQQQVAEKEKTVAQLDKYIREVNALKESFKVALLKLPNEREIAGLLLRWSSPARGPAWISSSSNRSRRRKRPRR